MKTLKRIVIICVVLFSFSIILSVFASNKTLMELNIIAIANAQDEEPGGGFTCKNGGGTGATQFNLECGACAYIDFKALSMGQCEN